jgi:hypothetical protein
MRQLVARLCKATTGLLMQMCVPSTFLYSFPGVHKIKTSANCCCSGPVPFRYISQTVANLYTPFHFNNKQAGQRCIWAYIDRDWCAEERRGFHSRRKRPVSRGWRAVQNANSLCLDPLYIAILIALAQKPTGATRDKEPLRVGFFIGATTTDR